MNNIDNSLFFNSFLKNQKDREKSLIADIEVFLSYTPTQVYLLDRILGINNKLNYDLNDVVYLIIPNYPILILFNNEYTKEQMEDYLEDLKEDIGQLSAKYS